MAFVNFQVSITFLIHAKLNFKIRYKFKKRLLLRCINHFKSDSIYNKEISMLKDNIDKTITTY